MSPTPNPDRLAQLEASVAHLERLYDQLNAVIVEQDRRLGRLQKRVEQITDSFETQERERLQTNVEKPPHYGR